MSAEAYNIIDRMFREAGITHLTPINRAMTDKASRHMWLTFCGRTISKPRWRRVWSFRNGRGGWPRFAHDLSHRMHDYASPPGTRPHAWNHLAWERAVVGEIIAKGLHLPKKPRAVRPAKPAPDPREAKRANVERRLKAWHTRAKRAATAIKKLERALKRANRPVPVTPPAEAHAVLASGGEGGVQASRA